ncbi:MAG: GDP-mannose 4,6-dehydratase [Candidatus Methanomethylicia archaeon]|nr:GDP-mannose 4,6-dehydratase [Candidatus Methanomethylicia archaeon]
MRKILVTGGAGFVGSHLSKKLSEMNFDVIVIDDLSNGRRENLEGVKHRFFRLDVSKKSHFIKFSQMIEHVDVIYHLACHPRSLSFQNPWKDVSVNVKGIINVLEYAKKIHPPPKIIFSSNSGIYGTPHKLPIDESMPDQPSTPYDVDKLAAEYFLKIYHDAYHIPITIFRFATVYGSRQRVSRKWKPVIAEFVIKMLKHIPPTIEGDGCQTRDFIHVSDVVNALVRAMDIDTGKSVLILSSNTETSINDLYKTISNILGFDAPPKKAPPKLGDVRRMWYDNSKAKRILNWEPKTTLRDGIEKDVIPHYKKVLGI